MKLFTTALFAAVAHALDCPNDGWKVNSGGDKCIPADGMVTIKCNSNNMVVTLSNKLMYVSLDATKADTADSSAGPKVQTGTECAAKASTGGQYSLTIPLDGCGTTVAQTDKITFSNTISANTAALTVDNIITTESLSLDVSCVFDSSFDLTVDDIGIKAGTHELAGSSTTGDFKSEFTIKSYIDSGFKTESSATNQIIIGKPVYNKVSVATLPTNVDFVVTGCTAQDAKTTPTKTYNVIKDGCLDKLLGTNVVTVGTSNNWVGDASDPVYFQFNGFTFEGASDTVYLKCNIELCATDGGKFMKTGCGYEFKTDASGTDCNKGTSTLGWNKAAALSYVSSGAP